MKLTIGQIQELLSIISKNHLLFIGRQLGPDFLSDQDRKTLKKYGVDFKKLYNLQNDSITNSLHLGLLADALESQLKNVTYNELQKYIESGNYIPLSERTRNALNNIKLQTYTSIKALEGKIFKDVNQILVDQDRKSQEEFIRKELEEGIKNKKTISEISHSMSEKTGDWSRDFDRIVQYNSQLAFEQGKAEAALKKGENTLVYKKVFLKACKYCKDAYQNKDGSPKIFKLQELIKNGSNIGRKAADWKATIDPIHPYCRCELMEVPEGYIYNPKTGRFDLIDSNYKPKIQRKKIKAMIGDREVWV